MITESGIRNLNLYCREPIENIKGYREAVESEDRGYVCHHINELTFTRKELKKLKMYYHRPASELIIMTRSEHRAWHDKWNGHPMKGRTGEKNPMYGRTGEKSPMYGKTGELSPMYGKGYLISGDKHPNWKGDKAGPGAMYRRALNLYKSGEMNEEEFQQFRDIWKEYNKMMKLKRKENQTI